MRQKGEMKMKKALQSISKGVASSTAVAGLMVGAGTGVVQAKEWQANVGSQSRDLGNQALGFLPNELWVHAGDSIRWTFGTNEVHTVTFLKPNQIRPPLYGAVYGVFL